MRKEEALSPLAIFNIHDIANDDYFQGGECLFLAHWLSKGTKGYVYGYVLINGVEPLYTHYAL